ncbi:MAG: type II restriction endonuclease [Candidatus Paceibacterota bacterium]|jgi:hypothetical protein
MQSETDLKLLELIKRGSATAKGGFKNEQDVVDKFNAWKTDEDAQKWLQVMGYNLKDIEKVRAVKITGSHKTDVQVEITIYFKKGTGIENVSIKLVSNDQGFNQIDKRWVDKYVELWGIPSDIAKNLKYFTGEMTPTKPNKNDPRRIFLTDLKEEEQNKMVDFFEKNKILIVADLFKGRDSFPASWLLLYQKNIKVWTLLPMSVVMNFYGNGPVRITREGSLKIGRIGMQRKGGDNGRPSATMLQFKINPCEIVKAPENG